jgi:glycosyltransferase involved in cell wall biosynthesis
MPAITALLHTCNDELRIGRALETLRPCDEIVIVDHGSQDRTLRIAREYGVVYRTAHEEQGLEAARAARCEWVLCLRPTESLSEMLEASLYEWKLREEKDVAEVQGVAVRVREEHEGSWTELAPELRLVRRQWADWAEGLPAARAASLQLEGDLLRFRSP